MIHKIVVLFRLGGNVPIVNSVIANRSNSNRIYSFGCLR